MGEEYTLAQAAATKKYLSKFIDIKIRVTPEEKLIIEENARQAGKSTTRYIKDKALKPGE